MESNVKHGGAPSILVFQPYEWLSLELVADAECELVGVLAERVFFTGYQGHAPEVVFLKALV